MVKVKSDLETICAIVCVYYNIDKTALFRKRRKRDEVFKRQVFHYLCDKYTDETLESIGHYYSDVTNWKITHSTVMHSCRLVRSIVNDDKKIASQVQTIEDLIQSNHLKIQMNFPVFKIELIKIITNSTNLIDMKFKLKNYLFG